MKEIIITIPKEFTVEEAADFREKTVEFLNNGEKDFLIDFKDCIFIDSTGLGVLVSTYKKCKELNGSFKLQQINENVLKIFKLTRLDRVFEIL